MHGPDDARDTTAWRGVITDGEPYSVWRAAATGSHAASVSHGSRWLRTLRPARRAALRLYCFPHAGGSASAFHRLAQQLDPTIEVVGVQYPGRSERLLEPPIDDVDLLVARLCDALEGTWEAPFGFLGLSFGALVAFATAHELRRRGEPAPALLLFGGREAPHLPSPVPPIHHLPEEEFVAALAARYGDPGGLLSHPEIAELVLPALHSDVRASALWVHRPEPPFNAPLVAFAGRDDADAAAHLGEWRRYTSAEFVELRLDGGHFVLMDEVPELCRTVTHLVRRLAGGPAEVRSGNRGLDRGYRAITRANVHTLPEWQLLSATEREAVQVVSTVLPFRTNEYVVRELIDWSRVPDDPLYQLHFGQAGMLEPGDYAQMAALVTRGAPSEDLELAATAIRRRLNPHPDGQVTHNVPRLDGRAVEGLQHKYRSTVLFFPGQGQTCHSYCTFCFRWAQFVAVDEARFEARETADLAAYLRAHPEVTEVLFTGGDPMVMRASALRYYLDPLLAPDLAHVDVRIGTKSVANWPYRYLTDPDADEVLRLFERICAAGRHLAVMAHYNHPRELTTEAARAAVRRIRSTGAEIRMQSPLVRHVNDSPAVWEELWSAGVRLGCIPYYMFVERDTGPRHFFEVPLVRAWEIFRAAYQRVSGLARTVRGPVMSTMAGKVLVDGPADIGGERVLALQFLQGRDPDWVRRPFFARYNARATWFDELLPAGGEREFFFAARLREFEAACGHGNGAGGAQR